MNTPAEDEQAELVQGITGRPDEIRLRDNSGHAIFVNKNSGQFLVRYKRDTDWDGVPEDYETENVIERRYNTMMDVMAFIDRRYDTQQRVRKSPLNIRVLTEDGPAVVKSIHGGTDRPIFDIGTGTTSQKQRRQKVLADADLFPVHDRVAAHLDSIKALVAQEAAIREQVAAHRNALRDFRISTGGYGRRFDSDEKFRQCHDEALACVTKAQAEVDAK